jgi:O-antigen ligase
MGTFFLIINTIRSRNQIMRLVIAIIIAGTIVAFLGIIQMVSRTDKIYWFWQSHYKTGGYFGPYVNPNHFAGYLEMVIPLTLGFLITKLLNYSITHTGSWRHRLSRIESHLSKNALLIFVIVIMAAALFLSLSRGGIISFLLSLVFFSIILGLKKTQRKKRKVVLIILGLVFAFLIWIGIDPVLKELSTLSNLHKASPHRPLVWKDTLNLVKDFPLFGVGLGNFQHLYPKYKTIKSKVFWDHTHNDYLEMLSDTGSLGVLFLFGGLVFFLAKIIKKWQQRRDPFVVGITLGGLTSVMAILLHSTVEFNLHIPANAMLLFIILGLTVATSHLKMRGKKEYSLLPTRTLTLNPRMKLVVYPLTLILIIGLSVSVVRGYLGVRYFQLSKSQNNSINPNDSFTQLLNYLSRAIALDPSNARYHYELGQYYANLMSKSWKEGVWKLEKGKWIFDPGEKTLDYGFKALDSYFRALQLQPTNAWYHFSLGWISTQLSLLLKNSINSMNSINPGKEFSLAVMLDPTNKYLRDYVKKWSRKNEFPNRSH